MYFEVKKNQCTESNHEIVELFREFVRQNDIY